MDWNKDVEVARWCEEPPHCINLSLMTVISIISTTCEDKINELEGEELIERSAKRNWT